MSYFVQQDSIGLIIITWGKRHHIPDTADLRIK